MLPREKVLFIRRPGAFGGIEILLLDWLKYIDYGKTEVVLGSTNDFFSAAIRKNGFPVEYRSLSLPVLGRFGEIYGSWAKDIRGISPDKIVIMQGSIDEVPFPSVLAAYVATRGNVYMTEHQAAPDPPPKTSAVHLGIIPGVGMWWYRMMLGLRMRATLLKRVLAVSEGVRNVLLMYGYPPEKIRIAYHGVNVALYSPSDPERDAWRRENGIPAKDLVFVSTARLAEEKRIDRMIRAFSSLSRDRDDIWLLIAGDGPTKDTLTSLAGSLKSKDRIRFLGHVNDIPGVLKASDVFVLPSDREGLSVSLTEAMAAGLICIASDVSGSNEVIRDGGNGFIVEPSDEGVLRGMEKVLALDGLTRDAIARNARETIVERFEMKKSIANILQVLEIGSILSPRPSSNEIR